MTIPSNLSDINENSLNIMFIPSNSSSNYSLLSWTLKSFTTNQLVINLNFSDPYYVSLSDVISFMI
jgi:hypothetical protein